MNANQHEIAMNSPAIWRSLLWTTIAIYLSAFMILFYKCVRTNYPLYPECILACAALLHFKSYFLSLTVSPAFLYACSPYHK